MLFLFRLLLALFLFLSRLLLYGAHLLVVEQVLVLRLVSFFDYLFLLQRILSTVDVRICDGAEDYSLHGVLGRRLEQLRIRYPARQSGHIAYQTLAQANLCTSAAEHYAVTQLVLVAALAYDVHTSVYYLLHSVLDNLGQVLHGELVVHVVPTFELNDLLAHIQQLV